MKKRIISLFLVFVTVLTMFPATALAAPEDKDTSVNLENPFTDVKKLDWYYDAVQYARVNGFFNGTSDTTFDPAGGMTRGMFVTVLGRMAGVDSGDYKGKSTFSDVSKNAYYAPYIEWAVKYGITDGTGDGTFSPDVMINRAQMATFFVRYFDAFDIDYETGENITTTPADIDSVPSWAKDAVLKLWKQGLLNGDGTNFDPNSNANRAQAATLCMRTDEAVDTWYKETGVKSDRVSIDPETGEAVKPGDDKDKAEDKTPEPDYGYTTTTYYQVTFGLLEEDEDVTMPDDKTCPEGTEISLLPVPHKTNGLFLGWYYDPAGEDAVGENDTITRDTELYAKMGEVTPVSEQETPNYTTVTLEVDGDGNLAPFSFGIVGGGASDVEYFTHVSSLNAAVTPTYEANRSFDITNAEGNQTTVTATGVDVEYKQGQTYSVKLKDDSPAVFVFNGTQYPATIRVLNIITEKGEVQKLSLKEGLIYLYYNNGEDPEDTTPSDVSGLSDEDLGGLFKLALQTGDGDTAIERVNNTGDFIYTGSTYTGINAIRKGDLVAIYSGERPTDRTETTDNDTVAYVEITSDGEAVDGGIKYTYKTAESEDVLFTPDVLPVVKQLAETAVMTLDGEEEEFTLIANQDDMDFTDDKYAEMGLDSRTTVDVGDYIAIYEGSLSEANAETSAGVSGHGYGEITAVSSDVDEETGEPIYIITYKEVSRDEVLAAMDLYSTRNEEIELSAEQIAEIERQMVEDATKSGFVVEAAEYLTALAIETNGFRELSDDLDMDLSSYSITFADGTPVDEETLDLMAVSAKITTQDVDANVTVGDLVHFKEDGDPLKGIRADLIMTFTVEIGSGDNKIEITLEAIFEQEVLININTSGGAIWKWKWIFPYIYDYELNANIDLGTYTGIGVTATAKTKGEEEEDEFSWKMSTGSKAGDKILSIGEQITNLMAEKEEFMGKFTVPTVGFDGEEVEVDEDHPTLNNGGLAEKYADMMENAEECWIDIVRVEIFSSEGHVDPLHILCYGISADFVVSANLYVTLGMTFEYGVAKRYNFSLMLFHKKSTNETIDLEEAHYQFDFYVMGTVGIRAGVEFEVAVGLFSLKLDSIGICAEAGAYARLWGYFYYSLNWTESEGKSSTCSGAMLIEIGLYLSISFKAQLFSNEDLTYQPTIYEKEWPLFTVGEAENVYDFAYEEDDEMLSMEVKSADQFTLSSDLFAMNYMDMKSGEIHGTDSEDGDDDDEEPDNPEPGNFDDATESHFTLEFSNPKFSYNPDGNIITMAPDRTTAETCEVTITWKHGTLAFSARPITRKLTIEWSDPARARFIAFDSRGGSAVPMISGVENDPITKPADPTRVGYIFGGWYEDIACTREFSFPTNLPDYLELTGNYKGITVYAKWEPAPNKYVVKHYQEQLNGTYRLAQVPQLDEEGNPVVDANGRVIMVDDTVDVVLTKRTGETTEARARDYEGFVAKPFLQKTIAADGSTVIEIYYYRETFDVQFTYGAYAGANNSALNCTAKYGATVYAPSMTLGGYDFDGFKNAATGTALVTDANGGFTVTADATYDAQWLASPNTPYRVEYYIERTYDDAQVLSGDNAIVSATGTTGSTVTVESCKLTGDNATGLDFDKATVNGAEVTETTIAADGSTVIKLYYTRARQTISFDTKGGTMAGESTLTVKHGETVTLPKPTRDGWNFIGWYTDEACENLFKAAGSDMSVVINAASASLSLYAKWEPKGDIPYTVKHYQQNVSGDGYMLVDTENKTGVTGGTAIAEARAYEGFEAGVVEDKTIAGSGNTVVEVRYDRKTYTVTFEANGGSTVAERTGVRHGATITAPAEPEKQGFDFDAWYSDSGLTSAWSFASSTVTKATTLYANWTPKGDTPYTVEYYKQDIGGGNNYTLAETDATKTGTTGGMTAAAASKSYEGFTAPQTVTQQTIAANGTTVVKVYYTRNQYTLTFKPANGGDDIVSTLYYGEDIAEPETDPTKTGYTFANWGDVADTMPAANTEYTAVWTANTYNVAFDKNDSKPAAAGVTVSGSMSAQEFKYDTAKNLPANGYSVPENSGWTFMGWARNANAEEAEFDDRDVININLATDNGATVTLYAVWQQGAPVTYTVRHYQQNIGGGDNYTLFETDMALPGIKGTLTAAKANDYVGFAAPTDAQVDQLQQVLGDEPVVIDIYYTRNRHTLTFKPVNGGEDIVDTLYYGEEITVPATDPTKTGYTFAGWGSVAATMPDSNLTYTAQWTVNKYTITFDTDGGSAVASITKDYGAAVGAVANPTKTGYTFAGWDKEIPKTMPAENMTVTAQWTVNEYTITFNTDGGNAIDPITQDYGTAVAAPAAPTKTGHTFTGWSPELPGTMPAENRTHTAEWRPNTYTVRFNANGGEGEMDDQSFTYGAPAALSANKFTKENYTFMGWATEENGGAVYTDGQNPSDLTAADGAVIDLYAVWAQSKFTLTYSGVGVSGSSIEYSAGESVTLAAAPERDGYTFKGWEIDKTTYAAGLSYTMPAKHVTATAVWMLNTYDINYNLGEYATEATHSNPGSYTVEDNTITLGNPTGANLTFRGWYSDAEFTKPVTQIAAGSTGDITLYAKWVCTVSYDFNNVGSEENYSVEVVPGTEITLPAIPSKAFTATEKYDINGWLSGENKIGGSEETVTVTSDMTLEADWTASERKYTVHWNHADGTPYSSQTAVTYDQVISIEDPVDEGVDSTTIYTQVGWKYNNSTLYATSGTTTIRELVNEAVPDSDTLNFYPVYNESTRYYTVRFYSGIKGLVTEKFEYGDKITVPTTISNYSKNGVDYTPTWYTSSNTSSSSGTVWDFDNGTVTKDGITLYARWRVDGVTDYNGIVVGGFGINDSNASDIPLPEGMTGTASYDKTNKILTLNNVSNVDADGNVTVDIMGFEGYFIYINASEVSPLTIVLNGECKLKTSASAIYARDLTIKGNGDATPDSLSISSGDYAIRIRSTTSTSYSLTVDGCTLNLNNTAYGLTSKEALCCSKLTLKGGANVTAVAPYNPITTSAAITFAGPATLTLEKTAADSKFLSATITAADGVSYNAVYSRDGAAVTSSDEYDTVVITAS